MNGDTTNDIPRMNITLPAWGIHTIMADVKDGYGNPIPMRQGPDEPQPTFDDWLAYYRVHRYLQQLKEGRLNG